MPTINISPKVRFILYLIGAISLMIVSYAVDKKWAGDAEVRLVTALSGLLFVLAAAKTNLSDTGAKVTGTVVAETGETGQINAVVGAPGDETAAAAENDLVVEHDVDETDDYYDGHYDGEQGSVTFENTHGAPLTEPRDEGPRL